MMAVYGLYNRLCLFYLMSKFSRLHLREIRIMEWKKKQKNIDTINKQHSLVCVKFYYILVRSNTVRKKKV